MNGLFEKFYDGLPVAPSQRLASGRRTRGWTLREDRLNANAVRFDWIHGTIDALHTTSTPGERDALRTDVLAAAARIATAAGFRVKADGIGLVFTPEKRATQPRR